MLEGAIKSLLASSSTITGLVKDRIRPLYAAQADVRPLLTIAVTNNQGVLTHSGGAGSRNASVEIGIITDTYADAGTLADAIAAVLHGYMGTTGNMKLWPVTYEDESDIEQAIQPGKSKPVFLKSVTYKVRYQQH